VTASRGKDAWLILGDERFEAGTIASEHCRNQLGIGVHQRNFGHIDHSRKNKATAATRRSGRTVNPTPNQPPKTSRQSAAQQQPAEFQRASKALPRLFLW